MTPVLSYHPVDSDAVALVWFHPLADLDVVALVLFHRLDVVALVRFHRLDAMIPVLFHRLVGAYAVIPVPFHPLADMDAVAPVQFHLCPVVAVAEDMLMTSKINYCVSYAMKTVVSQRKSQLMIIIYTWASMPRPINPEGYRSSHELTEMKS